MRNTLFFSIKPEFSSVEIVRKGVEAALNDWLGLLYGSMVDDFCQVVSELVNNAIEHGRCTLIEGEFRVEGDKALFTLTTDGVGFDPTVKKAEMPDFDEKDDLPEGGYGLAIIKRLADELNYSYEDGKNVTSVAKFFRKSA